jgi:hypothetical protein
MIRNLFIIAGASFVLAAVCFAGAGALGWRNWFDHGWGGGDWTVHLRNGDEIRHIDDHGDGSSADGAATTREIAWGGADGLDLDLPADVQFTQGPGPAKLTVSGPRNLVDRVEVSGSHLQLNDDGWSNGGRLSVVMSAPNVHRFAIDGDSSLSVANYDQDELDIDVSGHGDVTAKGKARAAHIDISGDGDVNLGALATDSTDADISGSGRASIAPASAADLRISGSGEIDLLTRPAKLTSDVSGSGRIVEGQTPQKPS